MCVDRTQAGNSSDNNQERNFSTKVLQFSALSCFHLPAQASGSNQDLPAGSTTRQLRLISNQRKRSKEALGRHWDRGGV